MHLVKDENGNICAHAHSHEHPHTHADGSVHTHEHCHEHGHEDDHTHSHGEACDSCGGCGHDHGAETGADKNAALLNYMYQHNQSHAAELDQMAEKLQKEGMTQAAEQIRKAVDEFQKGNMYLGVALSLVKENH